MKDIFPERIVHYNLRNKNSFLTNVSTVFNGTETITFRGSKTWILVEEKIGLHYSSNSQQKIMNWEPRGCMQMC